MVSIRVATQPLKPIPKTITDSLHIEMIKQAEAHYRNRQYRKASRIYHELEQFFNVSSPSSTASKFAMKSNILKMNVLEAIRTRKSKDDIYLLLEDAKDTLRKAFDHEPYWAEYRENYVKLEKYIHDAYGCTVGKKDGYWADFCGRICRELGLMAVSPGMTMRLECSICGKDPIACKHIAGEIYDGYVALHVARDIIFDHLSIVDLPAQRGTYIQPNPLSDEDLKKMLPDRLVKRVLAGTHLLTCKDLMGAIRKNKLRGIKWEPS